jgi:hypothetical protein
MCEPSVANMAGQEGGRGRTGSAQNAPGMETWHAEDARCKSPELEGNVLFMFMLCRDRCLDISCLASIVAERRFSFLRCLEGCSTMKRKRGLEALEKRHRNDARPDNQSAGKLSRLPAELAVVGQQTPSSNPDPAPAPNIPAAGATLHPLRSSFIGRSELSCAPA